MRQTESGNGLSQTLLRTNLNLTQLTRLRGAEPCFNRSKKEREETEYTFNVLDCLVFSLIA